LILSSPELLDSNSFLVAVMKTTISWVMVAYSKTRTFTLMMEEWPDYHNKWPRSDVPVMPGFVKQKAIGGSSRRQEIPTVVQGSLLCLSQAAFASYNFKVVPYMGA
jgi:hypothetical protein